MSALYGEEPESFTRLHRFRVYVINSICPPIFIHLPRILAHFAREDKSGLDYRPDHRRHANRQVIVNEPFFKPCRSLNVKG